MNHNLEIPDDEIKFTYSRSGGPGGQNVNKVNSKATLHWNVLTSPSVPAAVRQRFIAKFKNRISSDGVLVLNSQRYRDQPKNTADCLEKLAEMLRTVLQAPKPRRATKPTRGFSRTASPVQTPPIREKKHAAFRWLRGIKYSRAQIIAPSRRIRA